MFILHRTHKREGLIRSQSSDLKNKYILILSCPQNTSSNGIIMPDLWLLAQHQYCLGVLLSHYLCSWKNFHLNKAVKYLCLSLQLREAKPGIDKALISRYAGKVGDLGKECGSQNPNLIYKQSPDQCDSWEIYCTLIWETISLKFGCERRKTRYWQHVLPVLTCIVKGRKIKWTHKQAECLGPPTAWKEP